MDNIFGKLLPFFILTIFIIAMAPRMRRAYIKMHSSGNDRQKKMYYGFGFITSLIILIASIVAIFVWIWVLISSKST